MNGLVKKIVYISVTVILVAAFAVGDVFARRYAKIITNFLHGTGVSFDGDEFKAAQAEGDELCQELMREGIVLYKNDNNALPISNKKVNLMGWGASDDGFLLKGVGSGSSVIHPDSEVTLTKAFSDAGIEINSSIMNLYKDLGSRGNTYRLIEPATSAYSPSLMSAASDFSDVAIVVFSRNGGENIGEIPTRQTKSINKVNSTDLTRTYLQISKEEDELLDIARENFSKVIVIINSCNFMHLDFLEDDRVDAALFVGLTGQSGTRGIVDVLTGETNPSGRVTDIHIYDPKLDPSWVNIERTGDNLQYVEDIYYGYKWYETADAEGYFDDLTIDGRTGYDAVVQFPFGYGMSYTKFEWNVDEVSIPDGSALTKDSKIEITMSVTNTGNVAGKEVIQVYYTPPYIDGQIEKAHMNLAAFQKTVELQPGKTQANIKLSFSAYDMASYDCYDKNKNGFATYELDKGDYVIKLMNNSHKQNPCENNALTYKVSSTIIFDKDPVTGTTIQNYYTGEDAYAGVPIDGSTVGLSTPYLSRADFEGTFPTVKFKSPTNTAEINKAQRFENDSLNQTEMPTFGANNGHKIVQKAILEKNGDDYVLDANGKKKVISIADLTYDELIGKTALSGGYEFHFNEELITKLLANYNDPLWDELIDQLSKEEVKQLVELSGFNTRAFESVGKPLNLDYDGPAGFNNGVQGGSNSDWTAYPSETLIGCSFSAEMTYLMGLAMGKEASLTNLSGWYAPGVNLHRSPYTARNFEYYSEDGLLSGKLAAELIRGAKANGLYCYIKHFALSEAGPNPRNLNTWATEQNLRENYLRPFEIAVKEGGANAVMTAFNRIGATWAGSSRPLNVSILRGEWGFNGTVLTDWSNGDDDMNPRRGIRAGNDIWLNGASTNNRPISVNDATDMYCAKLAAKNVIYTYIDTYDFAINYDWEGNEKYRAEIGVRTAEYVFPLWIPLLIVGEVVILAGLVVWGVFVFKRKKVLKPTTA